LFKFVQAAHPTVLLVAYCSLPLRGRVRERGFNILHPVQNEKGERFYPFPFL